MMAHNKAAAHRLWTVKERFPEVSENCVMASQIEILCRRKHQTFLNVSIFLEF